MLLAVCLLASSVQAQGLFGAHTEPGAIPSRFIRFGGIDYGLFCQAGRHPGVAARMASITCVVNRIRVGISLAESHTELDGWSSSMMLPLHAGFTLWSNPMRTWLCYGVVPDVSVEVRGSLWDSGSAARIVGFRFGPSVIVAACCDIDYFGLGLRVETGWLNVWNNHPEHGDGSRASGVYAGLQLRLLAFGIGF